jgi:hypothetical protein
MNRRLTTYGVRYARRHPRRAFRIGVLGSSLLARRIKIAETRRQALKVAEPARRAATDFRVHSETRRARGNAVRAAHRVQRIGVTRALTDKQVARNLRRATHHASRAANLAVNPSRHRVKKTSIVVLGTGALAGAAYAGRRKYASSPDPWADPQSDAPPTAAADEGAPASEPTDPLATEPPATDPPPTET